MFRIFSCIFIVCIAFHGKTNDKCITQEFIEELRSQVNIQLDDAANFNRCKDDTQTYKLYQTLLAMKNVQLDSTIVINNPFNQNLMENGFWEFFLSRVKTIKSYSDCRPGVRAFTKPHDPEKVFSLCPALFSSDYDIYSRIETILHEARHLDDHGYQHHTCYQGPRKSQPACDERLNDKGSYAVSVEVFTRLALQGVGFSQKQKSNFQMRALKYADQAFIFPEPATASILTDQSGKNFLLHNNQLKPLNNIPQGLLASWDNNLLVIPSDLSEAYMQNLMLKKTENDFNSTDFLRWYNSEKIEDRPKYIDLLIHPSFGAFLLKNKIIFNYAGNSIFEKIDLPEPGIATLSQEELGIKRPNNQSFFVMGESRHVYEVTMIEGVRKIDIRKFSKEPFNFYSTVNLQGKTFMLHVSGKIRTQVGRKWQTFEPLKDYKFVKMSRPIFWSEHFVK